MKKSASFVLWGICTCAVFLADSGAFAAPAAAIWGSTGQIAMDSLSKGVIHGLFPAIAAGMLVFMIQGYLPLWQCSVLCLFMPGMYALSVQLLQSFVIAHGTGEAVQYGLSSNGFIFYFQEAGMNYLFPIFITGLSFYECLNKKKILSLISLVWSIWCWIGKPLIPMFVIHMNHWNGIREKEKAVRKLFYNGLSISAVLVLLFFIVVGLGEKISGKQDGILQ